MKSKKLRPRNDYERLLFWAFVGINALRRWHRKPNASDAKIAHSAAVALDRLEDKYK